MQHEFRSHTTAVSCNAAQRFVLRYGALPAYTQSDDLDGFLNLGIWMSNRKADARRNKLGAQEAADLVAEPLWSLEYVMDKEGVRAAARVRAAAPVNTRAQVLGLPQHRCILL